jgi:hypothetical protein
MSHDAQLTPLAPHAEAVGGEVQVAPEQQPLAQFAGVQPLQIPPLQVPGRHDWQAAPPLPHIVLSLAPEWQVVPKQQPGHDVESHTQPPSTQC